MTEEQIKLNHTCLQGYIDVDYNKLSKVFGNDGFELANLYIDNKSKSTWLIEGEINGEKVVGSIYDWQTGKGVHYTKKWHIGGFDKKVLDLVKKYFPNCNVVIY